jgi:hypothetical protein
MTSAILFTHSSGLVTVKVTRVTGWTAVEGPFRRRFAPTYRAEVSARGDSQPEVGSVGRSYVKGLMQDGEYRMSRGA